MIAIVNTKVILEDSIIWDGTVKLDKGYITFAGKSEASGGTEGCDIIDAHGLYTAPGLIDIHNHGRGMYNFNEDPLYCADFFLKHGVTTVLPAFYSVLSLQDMIDGANRIREAAKSKTGSIMNGLYMEGPYMHGNGSFQDQMKWNGPIDIKDYAPLVDALGDIVRVWAIDPAREGIAQFMSYVKQCYPDTIFSLGHSFATYPECKSIARYGLRLQTHHGDSGKAPGRAQGTIGAGCDEYALSNPDMYTELICDDVGIHLTPDMIRMVIRIKGVERIILISDSFCDKNGYRNDASKGIAYGSDLNYDSEGKLAGSHLTLDNACANMMKHSGYGLCHAIRFASVNPAKLLGIDNEYGSIEVGKRANVILIDDMVNVKKVFLAGEEVF